VLQRAHLVLGEDDDLAGSLGEAFEQPGPSLGLSGLSLDRWAIVANWSGDADGARGRVYGTVTSVVRMPDRPGM
jgi:hypothetical protein